MRTVTFTIPTLPNPLNTLRAGASNIQNNVLKFTDYANTEFTQVKTEQQKFSANAFNNFRNKFSQNKKKLKFVPFVLVGLVLMVAVGLFLRSNNTSVLSDKSSQALEQEKPLSVQTLNKNFTFPVLGADGKEAGKLQYTVETAELRDQLIIKGQQARAVDGRVFLIISVKLKNDTEHTISVNTRDFIRLKREGSDELLAPTIHNDPVEAQAISTLTTRLGFSLPKDSTKNMSLLIGEIKGKKQTVELDLN